MTWTDFVTRFGVEFAPIIEVQQLMREFQDIHQMTKTTEEIIIMFGMRALLVPLYVADEEMKKTRYHNMLMDDIREFVSMSSYRTL